MSTIFLPMLGLNKSKILNEQNIPPSRHINFEQFLWGRKDLVHMWKLN